MKLKAPSDAVLDWTLIAVVWLAMVSTVIILICMVLDP